jgi:hypothetical protein
MEYQIDRLERLLVAEYPPPHWAVGHTSDGLYVRHAGKETWVLWDELENQHWTDTEWMTAIRCLIKQEL